MSIRSTAVATAIILGLAGCSGSMPLVTDPIKLKAGNGEFTAMRVGCLIQRGEYVDQGGRGHPGPAFKFIAVNDAGSTIGEWMARCQAVSPNGMSYCEVITSGTGNATNAGGFNCPAFRNLRMVEGGM